MNPPGNLTTGGRTPVKIRVHADEVTLVRAVKTVEREGDSGDDNIVIDFKMGKGFDE